jgi:hypothetical protein
LSLGKSHAEQPVKTTPIKTIWSSFLPIYSKCFFAGDLGQKNFAVTHRLNLQFGWVIHLNNGMWFFE